MQIKSFLLAIWVSTAAVRASLNEPCYGAGGAAGMFKFNSCTMGGKSL